MKPFQNKSGLKEKMLTSIEKVAKIKMRKLLRLKIKLFAVMANFLNPIALRKTFLSGIGLISSVANFLIHYLHSNRGVHTYDH